MTAEQPVPKQPGDLTVPLEPSSATAGPTPIPEPGRQFDWASFARSMMLLFGEGASLGMYCFMGTHLGLMQRYIEANQLQPHQRNTLLLLAAIFGLLWPTAASCLFWLRRGGSLARLERAAHRASPVLIAAALPLLFNYKLWQGRELTVLVISLVVSIGFERALVKSLAAGPVLLPQRFAASIGAKLSAAAGRGVAAKDGPLYLTIAAASGYAAYFAAYALRGHYRFGTSAYDLGIENNLVWNAVHWGSLFKTSPLGGPTSTHLGFHQTYFAYLLGIPYRLWPKPEFLLVAQSFFVGAAAFPLFLWARRRVGDWVACAVALAYLLWPPLHGANLYDFHYQPLAPFFCWFTLYFIDRGKWGWTALFVLLSLSLREDISAMLAVFGLYLVVTNQRPKAGLALVAVGTVFFVGLKLIIMPMFLKGADAYIHQYAGLVPVGDTGFKAVLKTVFANPGYTLTTLLEKEKLVYVLMIFAPLAFLPMRKPIGLLFAIPGFFFTLLETGYPALVQTSFQYTIYWGLFLFPACAHILASPEFARIRKPVIAAFLLAVASNTYVHGAIIQRETIRAAFGPYPWAITESDRERHTNAYALMGQIPPLARVAAGEALNPHLSSRPDAYNLRESVHDAEYVLFENGRQRTDESNVVRSTIQGGQFGVIAEQGAFVLLKRGADPSKNAALLARLR